MYIIITAEYKWLHACNKNSSYRSIIRTIQLSARVFFVTTWCAYSVIFSELVPSNSASVKRVGNISLIKTSRNNNRVKYLFHRILSFTVHAHTTTRRIHDYCQVWGSLRLAPIRSILSNRMYSIKFVVSQV